MINCDVTKCAHNNHGECCANFVEIKGYNAATDDATFCSSYLNRDVYSSLTNNVISGDACDSLACEAATCRYNINSHCELARIQVIGGEANEYQATSCASFSSR